MLLAGQQADDVYSTSCPKQLKITCLGNAVPTVGWALPISINSQTPAAPHRHATEQSNLDNSQTEILFPDSSSSCQIDKAN